VFTFGKRAVGADEPAIVSVMSSSAVNSGDNGCASPVTLPNARSSSWRSSATSACDPWLLTAALIEATEGLVPVHALVRREVPPTPTLGARSRSTGAQSGTTTGCRRVREAVEHGRARLVGCERMSARTHTESLCEHAGGDEGLHRLEQTF
jgi:hypothetical protein